MNQKLSSSGFKIGTDDEGIDPYQRPDRPNRRRRDADPRMARLNRRLTLVIVLMPIFFVLLAAGAYFLLEKRVLKTRDFETKTLSGIEKSLAELQEASTRVDGRLTELTAQQNVLEKSMDEKEAPMNEAFMVFEKTAGTMRKDLKEVDERLKRIEAQKADADRVASSEKAIEELKKTDLPELGARMETLGQTVEPIQTDLQALRTGLSQLEEAYAQDKDAVSRSVEEARAELGGLAQDYKQLKKDLVDVLSVTIDQKGLNKAIQNQEKNYRAEVQALTRNIEAKDRAISQLQTDLKSLERRLQAIARTRQPLGTPKPGSFLEQNID